MTALAINPASSLDSLGRCVWRATHGLSHCVVTGTRDDARKEAARLLGAPLDAIELRKLRRLP